jgi:hypothetical protein
MKNEGKELPDWAKWSFSLVLVLFFIAGATLTVGYTTWTMLFGATAVTVYVGTMTALKRSGRQQ